MKEHEVRSSAANNQPSLTRSSSTNFTPLPVSQSRLPVVTRTLKRPSSPDFAAQEDFENYYYPNSSQTATPSPSKQGRIGGVADIVKQRFSSLTPSPLKVRSAVIGGIFSSSSAAQSTRRLSLGSSTALNAYGIRSSMSPIKSNDLNSTTLRKKSNLKISSSVDNERIKVCVRKRPLSSKELLLNHQDILEINPTTQSVAVIEDRVKLDGISRYIEKHEFRFDRVFNVESTNHQIYSSCVKELVDTVISGGRATCFAYGQTGSGKTHTMLNPEDGLNHLGAHDLFEQASIHLPGVEIFVTFYEIYQNSLYDLLNQKRRVMACEGKNGEVHIVGITEIAVTSLEHLQQIMQEALNTRSTGSTAANSTSSRSHAILQFILRKQTTIHGKFSFIDLAGSERGSDRANVDKQTKLEGAEINKSLLALKECIRAIDQDSSHLPFRQSKLTLVLKDSFTGNAKTCMIATVSPSSSNCEHTLNTLRYADRVKELKGSSTSNLDEFSQSSQGSITNFNSPVYKTSLPVKTTVKSPTKLQNPILLNEEFEDSLTMDDIDDNTMTENDLLMDSPLKLTESDDSFLLSTFSNAEKRKQTQTKDKDISSNFDYVSSSQPSSQSTTTKKSSASKLKESLHHSIAVLYDRVSNCQDADLLELLGDELEGLLAAFNK